MLALAIPQRGNGSTNGPPPDWVIGVLIGGGVLLVLFFGFVIVYAMTSDSRSRRKRDRILRGGAQASARVILIAQRPNIADFYDITLQVAPSQVVKSLAYVPLPLVPSVQVGTTIPLRYDPAAPADIVIDIPDVETKFY